MLDVYGIIDKYSTSIELKDVLVVHSRQVADMAVDIVRKHPELGADADFVWEASMLHDIGIVRCDAPKIYCFGSEPYIRHGLMGGEILRAEGLPRHARVAERHTGVGITVENIKERNLPLPLRDYSPETIEEQIICYADKFFSKTKLGKTKPYEIALNSLRNFDRNPAKRFAYWRSIFGV